MTEERKSYLMQEYQATYTEYMHGMNEYYRIAQGGGTFSAVAREKELARLTTNVTNLYTRLCFLSLILQ